MLIEEENRGLTQVGPGTPMGELMRRYWHPIAAAAELDDQPTKAVRLLGEDLVLYRDLSGTYGLIGRRCAHRRVDLVHGLPEGCGLRCIYHGWVYDETGQCIEQPFEETMHPDGRFKEKIRITAYPVQAKAGLLWAYLGPQPAPLVPDWEPFTFDDGFVDICLTEIPCNWLQCQENSIDPVHFEWLHSNWTRRLQGGESGPPQRRHLKVGFDGFDYGFIYRRVMEGATEQDEDWTVGRACLWPYALFVGSTLSCHFEWRVPVDDTTTMSVGWFINRVASGHQPPKQERIPYWYGPIKDESGNLITSHVMNQDFVAWVAQGTITDRPNEHLGESDRGVIMLRRKLQEQMAVVADGGEPMGVFRDPEKNRALKLPLRSLQDRRNLAQGTAPAERRAVSFQVGEPPDALEELRRVASTWGDPRA